MNNDAAYNFESIALLILTILFLILMLIFYFSKMHFKKKILQHEQSEQRLRNLVFDLNMRVKYQHSDMNSILSAHKASERKFELLCNLYPNVSCVLDSELTITQINCSDGIILKSDKVIDGKRFFIELLHPDDREAAVYELRNIAKQNYSVTMQNRCICPDDTYKTLRWIFAFVPEYRQYIGTAVEINNTIDGNEISNLSTVVKNDTEFLANLSHELKTPLNVLINTLQLLRLMTTNENSDTHNVSMDKYLHIMKQNCFRLIRLVNNMSDMTKFESGFGNLQFGNHNIIGIVEDICNSVAEYVESKNIDLIFDTTQEEVIVYCDPDSIERIILNLLSNAIKFTDPGGKIHVFTQSNSNHIFISVKDTGIGISNDQIATLFDRYKQVDKTLHRNKSGSGIGLSLVKSIVELHQGSVSVESTEGEGSKFTIKLPVLSMDTASSIGTKHTNRDSNRIDKITVEFSDIYV